MPYYCRCCDKNREKTELLAGFRCPTCKKYVCGESKWEKKLREVNTYKILADIRNDITQIKNDLRSITESQEWQTLMYLVEKSRK